jgi:hypothetical protein
MDDNNFGPVFESFVDDDQARRDRGDPIKAEPTMAAWLRALAAAAEYYAAALEAAWH